MTLNLLAHVLLMGLFMYLFLREIGAGVTGAAIARRLSAYQLDIALLANNRLRVIECKTRKFEPVPGGQVVNLDVRRRVEAVPLPGLPHLGSGISWTHDGRTVMATPNLEEGVVSVIDVASWKVVPSGLHFFPYDHSPVGLFVIE